MEDISQLRKKIFQLNERRSKLIERTMRPGKLLTASFYERYTKCGNANCKCATGELHGPFWWIYQNRKGQKLVSTSCVADKIKEARSFSENYKTFKEAWSKIQEIDEEISNIIDQIGLMHEVDIKEYINKKGERRGRKPKKSEGSAGEQKN